MEKVQNLWRLRSLLSYKNATIFVCFFNLLTALFLIRSFFSSASSHQPSSDLYRYIKESEELRRAMMPVDLIKRVRELEKEAFIEPEPVQQKDNKQTAAVDLISKLNNFRSYSDAGSLKALEEWRKRKMERARQRELGKNGTVVSQA